MLWGRMGAKVQRVGEERCSEKFSGSRKSAYLNSRGRTCLYAYVKNKWVHSINSCSQAAMQGKGGPVNSVIMASFQSINESLFYWSHDCFLILLSYGRWL